MLACAGLFWPGSSKVILRDKDMATNPTPPMILVTTHASSDVNAYDPSNGKPMGGQTLDETGVSLVEPRGIYLDSFGNMLLLDGGQASSAVYFYPKPTGGGGQYGPGVPLITPGTANSIDHPFALAQVPQPGSESALAWISNQDSNVVACFGLTLPEPVTASFVGLAPYLKQFGTAGQFLEGTWVASAVGNLPGIHVNPPVVQQAQGGLGATIDPKTRKVKHSVRDVAVVGFVLLVVDEASNVVRLYEAITGAYLGASTIGGDTTATLDSPTHLLAIGNTIFVSTSKHIYSGSLISTQSPAAGSLDLTIVFDAPGGDIAGMAVDSSGYFYFADRTEKHLYSYTSGFATRRWKSPKLTDEPEFLLYIGD
jgi:hypothetical protein